MRAPLIVLKLGGSVLADASALHLAVHEVYRWRRAGHDVVAVVSALAGVTDALLRRSRSLWAAPSPHAVAALLATGERESAALLAGTLDAAGVPARVLDPAALGLAASGDPLDATPVDLDESLLRLALSAGEVAVVPGFVAQARDGRTVLLGRGGSDLTALFLAARLRADRCRLVKDVDGLYEHDPAHAAATGLAPPARWTSSSWEDALATEGTIVQRKALGYARACGRRFELGRRNGTRPTVIGTRRTRVAGDVTGDVASGVVGSEARGAADVPRRLRVALLGLGTVGAAVAQRLAELPEEFEVVAAAVRDPSRPRAGVPPHVALSTDACGVAACGADVVVEALGGLQPARAAIEAALRAGAHVVTANKAVLAAHGAALEALARAPREPREHGVRLRWSAAAGGAAPVLEAVSRAARAAPLLRVDAVLNGTSNVVLEALARGVPLDAAVEEARRAGLAEADPDRDLSGRDAADKLVLVHHAATGRWLDPERVRCTGLTARTVDAARRAGAVVRQVASLEWRGGEVAAVVRPLAVPAGDPLALVSREDNAAVLRTARGATIVRGRGAGGAPTATAVLGDLLALARGHSHPRAAGRRPRARALAGGGDGW